eukprot:758405-Hanusia_phi.AAC.5
MIATAAKKESCRRSATSINQQESFRGVEGCLEEKEVVDPCDKCAGGMLRRKCTAGTGKGPHENRTQGKDSETGGKGIEMVRWVVSGGWGYEWIRGSTGIRSPTMGYTWSMNSKRARGSGEYLLRQDSKLGGGGGDFFLNQSEWRLGRWSIDNFADITVETLGRVVMITGVWKSKPRRTGSLWTYPVAE